MLDFRVLTLVAMVVCRIQEMESGGGQACCDANKQLRHGTARYCGNHGDYWTQWMDDDNPAGTGDYELIGQTKPCNNNNNAMAIQARNKANSKEYITTEHSLRVGPFFGLHCYGSNCDDYRVKYQYILDVYDIIETPSWIDGSNPNGIFGDNERNSKNGISADGNQFRIRYETSPSSISRGVTRNTLYLYPTYGLRCKNSEQKGNTCADYEVRYRCPGFNFKIRTNG